MRATRYYLATLKEAPQEAELPSHKLMLRAGLIRKLAYDAVFLNRLRSANIPGVLDAQLDQPPLRVRRVDARSREGPRARHHRRGA